MISDYIGPSCAGKSTLILSETDKYNTVSFWLNSCQHDSLLKRAIKKVKKIEIAFRGFFEFKPRIRCHCASLLTKIRIYMNLCYRLGLIQYIQNLRPCLQNLIIDEGPCHIPFTLFDVDLLNIDPWIAYPLMKENVVLIKAERDELLRRITQRGHWRITPDKYEKFIDFNLETVRKVEDKINDRI